MACRINLSVLFAVLIIAFFANSCIHDKALEISGSISKIKADNISDERLIYFSVAVEKEREGYTVKGATASDKAYSELQKYCSGNEIEFRVALLPSEQFHKNPWGLVTLSVCNIRRNASHSSELVTQSLMGTPVKIYSEERGWYLIQTPDQYFGWVDAAGITPKTELEINEWKKLEKVIYNRQNGFIYSEAKNNSTICSDLVLANLLSIIGETSNFYHVIFPDGRKGFVKKEECTTLDVWRKKDVLRESVISIAFDFKGTPYLWGGTSAKMVDCSGFTKTVYYLNGILLQRDASQQALYGELINAENNYEKLKPGDLIFFGRTGTPTNSEKVTHVGLFVGNSEFIHASGSVRINSLDKRKTNYTKYYEKAFIRARRIINHVDGEGIEWIIENDFYKQILSE